MVLEEVELLMIKPMTGKNGCWVDRVVFPHWGESEECAVAFDP